jgi:hypothetical protein
MNQYPLFLKPPSMNRPAFPKKQLNYFWQITFGVIIFGLIVTFGLASIRNIRLRHYAKNINTEITEIQKDNDEIARQISAMQNDPVYRESVIRNELKRGKPGEIIIQRTH